MDYISPTFAALKTRIEQDFSSMPAVLRIAFAVVLAKAFKAVHLHLEYIDKESSPLLCSLKRLYDWAVLYSTPRLDAVQSSGQVNVTGNVGAFVLQDVELRGDNGLDYIVLAAVEIEAGDNQVTVRCNTAGRAGNLVSGSVLTFINPQPGIDSEATVAVTGVNGGEEQEAVEPWRARVVDEWQVVTEYGGRSGKPRDYVAWAKKAHPSVTGALVFRGALGLGTILVKPICNGLAGRLPTPAIMEAIADKIVEAAPGTADWRLALPGQHLMNFNLELNPAVDNARNRDLIVASLNAMVLSENSEDSIIYQAEIDSAIIATTNQYTRIAPVVDTTVDVGSVFIVNAVVFS